MFKKSGIQILITGQINLLEIQFNSLQPTSVG